MQCLLSGPLIIIGVSRLSLKSSASQMMGGFGRHHESTNHESVWKASWIHKFLPIFPKTQTWAWIYDGKAVVGERINLSPSTGSFSQNWHFALTTIIALEGQVSFPDTQFDFCPTRLPSTRLPFLYLWWLIYSQVHAVDLAVIEWLPCIDKPTLQFSEQSGREEGLP